MKKKLIAILVAFGIEKAKAEKYLTEVDTDDPTFEVEKVIEDFKETQKDLLKNDKDFVGEIQKAEAAKRNDMWRSKIKKKTGLTAEEIKDKTDEEIIELAVSKLSTKGDATLDQLQKELLEANTKIKTLEEEVIPAAKNEAEVFKKNFMIELKQEKLLGALPKKLRVGNTAALATLKAKLGDAYKFEIDEKGELTILTKDGMKPKNQDGTKFLTAAELITNILDEEKLLENSAGGQAGAGNGGGQVIISKDKDVDPEKVKAMFPHLAKAQANQEAVKAAIEANKSK